MKKIKRILSLILFCTMTISTLSLPTSVFADVNTSGKMDDAIVKNFLNYGFTNVLDRTGERRVSSWDINTAGGVLNPGPGLSLTDNSDVLPVEASRQFEDITFGEVVMEFPIVLNSALNGASITLKDGASPVFQLNFSNDTIYCNNGTQNPLPLQNYKIGGVYGFKITMDFDKKVVKTILIDGKKTGENIPFLNGTQKANNIIISTGDTAKGSFGMQSIRIYRGYYINESFSMNGQSMPSDWELESAANADIKVSTANINANNSFDAGSALLSSTYGRSALKRSIDKVTDRCIFEFQLLEPTKRDGVQVSLMADNSSLFTISTNKNGFAYSDINGNPVNFYNSLDNIWYHFRIDYDPQKHKADLYMNGKKQVMDIKLPTNINFVNSVKMSIEPNDLGDIMVDNVLLFPYEEFEDYVPAPVVPPKDDVDIGMQMCSLWTEGLHFGYDYLNDAPARKPVLGFYDEGSPEVADWEIKYMVEHGVDFQWYCWFKAGNPDTPIQDGYMSPAIHEGFFNAKYSDQMKFAIMWENVGVDTFTNDQAYNKKCFLENVAPFWIEYFFKDPRYYKINGRPIVGAYYVWKLSERFGDEGFAQMLTEFEQMCVDAGVGKPFFIQQFSMDKGVQDFYNKSAKQGVSATYAYNHGNIWPELMYEWNEDFHRMANKAGLQFIPSVNPGFDAFPWGQSVGSLWDGDNLKTFLTNMKEKLLKTGNTDILGQKLLMLCSWNEYNEGHYFCPTSGTGFQFLDAVREVFVGDTTHTDVVPTPHQLDRINNLYPENRVTPTREGAVDKKIPENSYSKAKWVFDKNLGQWNMGNGIKSSKFQDGGVAITTTAGDVSLYISPENLEISDVSHIKIRMKNNSAINDIKLKTTTYAGESTLNQEYRNYIKPYDNQYVDVVFDMRKYPTYWKGLLKKLQLECSVAKDGETIQIESIELFGNQSSKDEAKLTLNINGWEQKIDSTVVENKLYVPLRTISDSFKGSIYWKPDTESVYMKIKGKNVVIPHNSDKFTVDGVEKTMANYAMNFEDKLYVNLDFLATILGKDVKWNKGTNTLGIWDIFSTEVEQPNSERNIVYEADFSINGNTQGYSLINASGDVSGGYYNISYDAGDPIINAPDLTGLRINTGNAKMFAVGIKSNKDFDARVYFSTDKNPGVNESQAFGFKVNASTTQMEYAVKIDNPKWDGNITHIRFDTGDNIANSIQLAYIRLYGDFDTVLTKDEILMRFDSIKTSSELIGWDMDINNKKDGWAFNKSVANAETKDGWLNFLLLKNDGAMYTLNCGNILASDVNAIEFRMKNETDGTKATIYYTTDTSTTFDAEKSFEVDINQNGTTGDIYTVDTKSSKLWKGNITGIKIVPSNKGGNVGIDYVYLLK